MLQVAVIFLLLPAVSGQLAGSWQTKVKEMDISADYCVFPFQYKGLLYHSCTGVNSANGRLWCSLTSNYDQDRLWGYCLGKESFGETEPSCVFPFIYGNKRYYSCTTAYWFPGLPWCSSTANYDKDKKWVYCSSSGVRVSSIHQS